MQRFLNQLIPFILMGIAIVAFAFGVFILAYIFMLGALIGLVLYVAAWIKQKFFPPKSAMRPPVKKKTGRVIDSNDWKNL